MKKSKTETFNRTSFSLEQINAFPVLGTTVSKWRQRTVVLCQHPTKEDHVVSIGTTFDNTMVVIAEEPKSQWVFALEYAKRGKVYVSE